MPRATLPDDGADGAIVAKNKPRKLPHVVKILRDGDDLIYREERGILEKELPLNKTPDVPGHVLEAARLVEAARAEMRAVYGPTVDVLFDEVLNAAEDPAEVENALGVWLGHITYNHGVLGSSPSGLTTKTRT